MRSDYIYKSSMFLSSYAPLFLSLALLKTNSKILWGLFAVSTFSVLVLALRIRQIKKHGRNKTTRKVKSIGLKNSDILSYVVTYLVPFSSAFPYNTKYDYLAFFVLFATIAVVYLKANLLHINPTLSILGYNVYELTLENNSKKIIITKRKSGEFLAVDQVTYCELEVPDVVVEV